MFVVFVRVETVPKFWPCYQMTALKFKILYMAKAEIECSIQGRSANDAFKAIFYHSRP